MQAILSVSVPYFHAHNLLKKDRTIPAGAHDDRAIWLGADQERRSGRLHMGLAVLCVGLAVILVAARAADLIEAKNTLLVVCAMGLLLLPLVFVDPLHGLMVYAVLAPMSPEADVGTGIKIRVQDPLIAVILLGVIVQELRGRYSTPPLPLKRPLFIYAAFAVFSSAIAFLVLPVESDYPPNVFFVLKLIQFIILAMCVALSIKHSRHIWMLTGALMVGFMMQSVLLKFSGPDSATSVLDKLAGGVSQQELVRRSGTAFSEQANVLSVFLLMMICFTLGFIDRTKNLLLFIGLAILLVSAGYDFLATKSRTGYIPAIVVLVSCLFFMRRKWIAVTLILLAAFEFWRRADLWARFQSIGAVAGVSTDSSYDSRLRAYDLIWQKLTYGDNSLVAIWFGGGRGSRDLSFADTQWGIELLYGGLLGVAAILLLVVAVLIRAATLWYKTYRRDDEIASVSLGALLISIVATISMLGLTSWSAIRTGELIFMSIGLIMACHRLLEVEEKLGVRSRARTFSKPPSEVAAYAQW